MSREWQQTRFAEYVMPDAVYYQTIWAVRDLERMENRLKEINTSPGENFGMGSVVSDGNHEFYNIKPTEDEAIERINLEHRVDAIERALSMVPKSYRQIVMDNIVLRTKVSEYRSKIWKIWKQRFLFNVAKNLSLI